MHTPLRGARMLAGTMLRRLRRATRGACGACGSGEDTGVQGNARALSTGEVLHTPPWPTL